MVTEGTLTLNGKGVINGVGNNDWNMALWAKDNGKIVINDGYFTNTGLACNRWQYKEKKSFTREDKYPLEPKTLLEIPTSHPY